MGKINPIRRLLERTKQKPDATSTGSAQDKVRRRNKEGYDRVQKAHQAEHGTRASSDGSSSQIFSPAHRKMDATIGKLHRRSKK